jgi:hypothetical protein
VAAGVDPAEPEDVPCAAPALAGEAAAGVATGLDVVEGDDPLGVAVLEPPAVDDVAPVFVSPTAVEEIEGAPLLAAVESTTLAAVPAATLVAFPPDKREPDALPGLGDAAARALAAGRGSAAPTASMGAAARGADWVGTGE